MKVRELCLDIRDIENNAKQQLIGTVKQNFSLRSVEMKDRPWTNDSLQFDNLDEERLDFYANRNEKFLKLSENHMTLQLNCGPKLCSWRSKLAKRACSKV